MTKKWRSPLWIAIAFIALFAMALPSLAWACPMTGRVGDTAMICDHAATDVDSSDTASTPPCCQHPADGKCCKPVPQLPSNDSRKDTSLTVAKVAASDSLSLLAKYIDAGHSVAVFPAPPLAVAPPHGLVFERTVSALPLFAKHTPPVSAGRAPPAI
jgi:hypothetical protein